MRKTAFLFTVILIEGYVVLAGELLVIRQLIPFVGSGTEVIAMIIAGVLMPLSIGYHMGGLAYTRINRRRQARGEGFVSIRFLLVKNILKAAAILGLGLSWPILELFFTGLSAAGFSHRLVQTAAYVCLFLVCPVYLLGQTVPLISHYFSRRKLSEITGKMLFFSTTGSFLGSICSTLFLMRWFGVHNTVIVTIGLLCALGAALIYRKSIYESLLAAVFFVIVCCLNGSSMLESFHIVSDNAYNTISIRPQQDDTHVLEINRSISSKFAADPGKRYEYIRYIEDHFINPLIRSGVKAPPPRKFLVIGAGGFTVGWDDRLNDYTFVDIDASLQPVSERYFLPGRLPANKHFVVSSARAFAHRETQRYDLIVLDTYSNRFAIPLETTSREYLLDVKGLLKEDGIVIANIISSPGFDDAFTVRYDNTFTSVFPNHSRQLIGSYSAWATGAERRDVNALYIYRNTPYTPDRSLYTDDRNSFSFDR